MIDLALGVLRMLQQFLKLDGIPIGFSNVEGTEVLIERFVFEILDRGERIHYQYSNKKT